MSKRYILIVNNVILKNSKLANKGETGQWLVWIVLERWY